jgi:hypothetical protein
LATKAATTSAASVVEREWFASEAVIRIFLEVHDE